MELNLLRRIIFSKFIFVQEPSVPKNYGVPPSETYSTSNKNSVESNEV